MFTLIKYICIVLFQLLILGDSVPAWHPDIKPAKKADTLCFTMKNRNTDEKQYRGKSTGNSDEAQIPESKIWIINKNIILGE